MKALTSEDLANLGFIDVGRWFSLKGDTLDYLIEGDRASNDARLDAPNALYAFVQGNCVKYIGKTARSVRRRFKGYCKPGKSQTTNMRCHGRIQDTLMVGAEVRILVFAPISELRYLQFEVNLAAALEDSLIKSFDPPWNSGGGGKPISEEVEREEAEEAVAEQVTGIEPYPLPNGDVSPIASFTVTLGEAYYNQGLINPGADASAHLGQNDDPILVEFNDSTEPVLSRINRRANSNGTVRVVGANRHIADWFQRHFHKGEVVDACVLDANRILLMRNRVLPILSA